MKLLAVVLLFIATCRPMSAQSLAFDRLPDLPDPEGFAGMFAGASGGALIATGGANFPGLRPWEGGTKSWSADIWVLERGAAAWRKAPPLERSLGYGVSATWNGEVICAGGSDAAGHHAVCFTLALKDGRIARRKLPDLPSRCANHCGALMGDTLFIAGGIDRPDATRALHTFWSLNLARPEEGWKSLAPWPGKERMLAVAAAHDGAFYLFGGAALRADAAGKPERIWLRDASVFRPGSGWEPLPEMPRPAVAAPSPAPASPSGILILSGDDGSKIGFKPETDHPGFPRTALLYEPRQRRWSDAGAIPFSRATVPTAPSQGGVVIVSGEARPGYRTREVWRLAWP